MKPRKIQAPRPTPKASRPGSHLNLPSILFVFGAILCVTPLFISLLTSRSRGESNEVDQDDFDVRQFESSRRRSSAQPTLQESPAERSVWIYQIAGSGNRSVEGIFVTAYVRNTSASRPLGNIQVEWSLNGRVVGYEPVARSYALMPGESISFTSGPLDISSNEVARLRWRIVSAQWKD